MMVQILNDWLHFASDVQPGCAAGEEELNALRARTEAAIASLEEDEAFDLMRTCDVENCTGEWANMGGCWRETGYWCCCSKHAAQFRAGAAQPPMKQMAIDREARRGPDGILLD